MKKKPVFVLIFLLLLQTAFANAVFSAPILQILREFQSPSGNIVMVVAHRGDWQTHPENSLEAIRSAIEIGTDIVEIDVRQTKDGEFVLMHDSSLDRTTNGKGKVADKTMKELAELRLKDSKGKLTGCSIPTLREVLILCKDRIMVNLDKVSAARLEEVYALAVEIGIEKQIILKSGSAVEKVQPILANAPSALFMPVITLDVKGTDVKIDEYERQLKPFAYEIIPTQEPSEQFDRMLEIARSGRHIWINTLTDKLCLGHSDKKAVAAPAEHWGWAVKRGATIIQTDRSRELIRYLDSIGKRWKNEKGQNLH